MQGIYQFAANLLRYIPTKHYWNRSTSDLVIAKSKRVNFFLKHSVFKVAVTAFNCIHGIDPTYIKDACMLVVDIAIMTSPFGWKS